MKKIEISDMEAKRAVFRAMLRQKTRIDPEVINRGIREITQTVDAIEKLARPFEDPPFLAGVSKYLQSVSSDMIGLRSNIAYVLVAMYEQCLPKNVKLSGPAILSGMEKKVGSNGFDVAIMEEQVVDLFPRLNDIALEQLLWKALTMLPPSPEGRPLGVRDMRKGETLILHTSWLPLEDVIDTIGKLSRIVVLNEEAGTARGCKQKQPAPQQSSHDVRMVKGEPIRQILYSSHGSHLIEVVYETPEQARKVAKMLIARKEEQQEVA